MRTAFFELFPVPFFKLKAFSLKNQLLKSDFDAILQVKDLFLKIIFVISYFVLL